MDNPEDIIILFAAGDDLPSDILDDLPEAALVVAADGGYDLARALGIAVDVVVGDMDSIEDPDGLPGNVIVESHSPDKDATDLELALDRIALDRPARVVVVGGAGGRVDHELATAALLCADRYSAIEEIDWLTGRASSHVIRRRRTLHADVGTMMSLLPVNGDAYGVTTAGLQWALEDATILSGSTRGVSNRFTSPAADIQLTGGVLLAVIPRVRPGDPLSPPDRQ